MLSSIVSETWVWSLLRIRLFNLDEREELRGKEGEILSAQMGYFEGSFKPIWGIDNDLQMKYSLASVSVGLALWLSQQEGF